MLGTTTSRWRQDVAVVCVHCSGVTQGGYFRYWVSRSIALNRRIPLNNDQMLLSTRVAVRASEHCAGPRATRHFVEVEL